MNQLPDLGQLVAQAAEVKVGRVAQAIAATQAYPQHPELVARQRRRTEAALAERAEREEAERPARQAQQDEADRVTADHRAERIAAYLTAHPDKGASILAGLVAPVQFDAWQARTGYSEDAELGPVFTDQAVGEGWCALQSSPGPFCLWELSPVTIVAVP